jgi:class 3 adenylate cyclase
MVSPRPELPTGTVTFLRTDVEGSMRLARAFGSGWDALNEAQLGIIRDVVGASGGVQVRTEGDAFFGAFRDAPAAAGAAIEIQRRLESGRESGCTPARPTSRATTSAAST